VGFSDDDGTVLPDPIGGVPLRTLRIALIHVDVVYTQTRCVVGPEYENSLAVRQNLLKRTQRVVAGTSDPPSTLTKYPAQEPQRIGAQTIHLIAPRIERLSRCYYWPRAAREQELVPDVVEGPRCALVRELMPPIWQGVDCGKRNRIEGGQSLERHADP